MGSLFAALLLALPAGAMAEEAAETWDLDPGSTPS